MKEIKFKVKDEGSTKHIGVQARDKGVLVSHIKNLISRMENKETDIVLSIKLPCNTVVEFDTFDDIPKESMRCPCGNPNHLAIQYGNIHETPDGDE